MFQVVYGVIGFLVATGAAVLVGFWLAKKFFPWLGRTFKVPPLPLVKRILSAIGGLVFFALLGMFLVPWAMTIPSPRLPALALVAPTAQPSTRTAPVLVEVRAVALAQELPSPYESEGGLPTSGSSWSFDVAPGEVEVLTGGPASIAGVNLPGGEDRGSVVIMLPSNKVVIYTIDNLIAGANWHGAYNFDREVTEADWRALAAGRIAAMKAAPNCTFGKGCSKVDVLVIGPGNKVVAQWTE